MRVFKGMGFSNVIKLFPRREHWLLVAGTLALSACSVAGAGPGLLSALFALALLLSSCATSTRKDAEGCEDGEWISYQACQAGQVTDLQACCPTGVECNFGQAGFNTCDDGSCTPTGTACDEGCDGTWEAYETCEAGEVVQAQGCCPSGLACNFGQVAFNLCDDGSCRPPGMACGEDECEGPAQRFQYCDHGAVVDATYCCPENGPCLLDTAPLVMCDDGSCVQPGEVCGEVCDGDWSYFQTCVDGVVTEERGCCMEGWVCNFGMGAGFFVCDDGSCSDSEQDCDRACDGSWVRYESCMAGAVVDHMDCCPAGVECNFGAGDFMRCDDGSCAMPEEACP